MKNADLSSELSRIHTALDILDPESEDSLTAHMRSTCDRMQKTIEKLSADLHSVATHLPAERRETFLKAAAAMSEIARMPAWKKPEELSLLLRAATGNLADEMEAVSEQVK